MNSINKEKVNKGLVDDFIQFERHGIVVFGQILLERENSVMVRINKDIAKIFSLETNATIVRHGNYEILTFKDSLSKTIVHNEIYGGVRMVH